MEATVNILQKKEMVDRKDIYGSCGQTEIE